jgi:DNA-directed RNA polymerase specialized sigma24 family protein
VTDPATDLRRSLARLPPAERFQALYALPAAVDAELRATVRELRDHGLTWAEIGALVGVTRQTVQGRFGKEPQ